MANCRICGEFIVSVAVTTKQESVENYCHPGAGLQVTSKSGISLSVECNECGAPMMDFFVEQYAPNTAHKDGINDVEG